MHKLISNTDSPIQPHSKNAPNIPNGMTPTQYHIRRRWPYIWTEHMRIVEEYPNVSKVGN